MVGRLLGIRPRDYRDTTVGFVTLALAMSAHAVLEAARDALFLATLPAALLPWAYLAMAALAIAATAFQRRVLSRLPSRVTLSFTLIAAALITLSFWFWSSLQGSAGTLVAFYVWTGLLATIVVIQFWLLVGDVMDLGQAKRAFAVIGAGGLLGATVGSLLASAALLFVAPRTLPLLASGLLLLGAVAPRFFSKRGLVRRSVPGNETDGEQSRIELLRREPYLRQLMLLVLLGTITVTGVDYVFKAMVAREIPAERLGDFFARYYAVLNGLALVVQLVLAPRLLAHAGLHRTLLLMPVLICASSMGFALAGGLVSVLLLKGTDGTLRHSVNRVGTEILYLPLSNQTRQRMKGFIEAVGQRGGQALASVAILAVLAFGGGVAAVAWGVVVLAGAWLIATIGLEKLYVELFRNQLKAGTIATQETVPELDLRSLEALIAALSAEDDVEVIAALDMFETYAKTNLVPPLILYHPSRAVVLRALELFAGSERPDVIRVAARLARHADPDVRAAALRVHAEGEADESLLARKLGDESPAVQATALIGLVHTGRLDAEKLGPALDELAERGTPEARLALAQSLHLLPAAVAARLAERLVRVPGSETVAAVARALAAAPDRAFIPILLKLLSLRHARADARHALVALGDEALAELGRALTDPTTARAIRRHVPRTISRFASARAVGLLERALTEERDEVVAVKILRALGRMRADDPSLPVDERLLERLAELALERAISVSYQRHFVELVRECCPRLATPASELLLAALSDHEHRALERAFRLMHILVPAEELEIVYDALGSSDRETHARGRELLEHVAPPELKAGVLALVDDAPTADRLREAMRFYEPPGATELLELEAEIAAAEGEPERELIERLEELYADLLAQLNLDRSQVLASIAEYHTSELAAASDELTLAQRERYEQSLTERVLSIWAAARRGEMAGAR